MSEQQRNPIRATIRQALSASTNPLGLSFDELQKLTKVKLRSLSTSLLRMRELGQVFDHGKCRHRRHFATKEARDAAIPLLDAQTLHLKNLRRLETNRAIKEHPQYHERLARRVAKQKAKRAVSGAKPRAVKAVKLAKDRPMKPPPSRKPAAAPSPWKNLPAVIPAHVKVQRLSGYTGDRWNVKVPIGGFVSEWKALRGQA